MQFDAILQALTRDDRESIPTTEVAKLLRATLDGINAALEKEDLEFPYPFTMSVFRCGLDRISTS